MLRSRPFFTAPFPLATAFAWAWSAVTILLLLGVPWSFARTARRTELRWLDIDRLWLATPIPSRICWLGTVVVVWLWVNHRTQLVLGRRRGETTLGLLASALLVALVAAAVLVTVRASPVRG